MEDVALLSQLKDIQAEAWRMQGLITEKYV